MAKQFTKPAVSIQDQVTLLEERGLIVPDRAFAAHCLSFISYYRLRAYWYYFELDPEKKDHNLQPGTTLDQVLALYDFDRKLRLIINDGIERIEVAARGNWAYALAMGYGPHGYTRQGLYKDAEKHRRNFDQLDAELKRSHDNFIAHYNKVYGDPAYPPIWMTAEVISFGLLSKMISTLASRSDRTTIARPFELNERVLTIFLHHLATVRNICAHHGRLWNRRLTVTLPVPTAPRDLAASVNSFDERRIYNTLTMMLFVMRRVAPAADWRTKLLELLRQHPTNDLGSMGFPNNWDHSPVWKTVAAG